MVDSDRVAQMRRGVLEYCVMALLREERRYGLDLLRSLGELEGMVTSEGTIYPLLTRLRRDGLVDSVWQESPYGPPRRYYGLTARGKRAFETFAKDWRQFRDAVDELIGVQE